MHYLICLAHFCELHGPSTIICTQRLVPEKKESLLLPPNSKLQTCLSCKLNLPDDAINLDTIDADYSYISTQYPASPEVYSALTKLAMKTLSVETASDITRPLFFGDTVNGYCINKIFKILDINARGGERKYSLMVVCDDERQLLLQWDTISIYLNELISYIQGQVTLAVERESKKNSRSKSNSIGNSTTASGNTFDNEIYLRRSLIKPKSLIELTSDDQLFVKLHLLAIELLKDINI